MKRINGRTVEALVFRLLRTKGAMTPRAAVASTGLPIWSVRKALYRLRDKGYARKVGPVYEPVKERAPRDGRGSAIESRANLCLALPGEGAAARYRKERGVFHPKPKPATALEAAWGFLPVSNVAFDDEAA